MPRIVAATRDEEALTTIRRVFAAMGRVERVRELPGIHGQASRACELYFVDVDLLHEAAAAQAAAAARPDWRRALQDLRRACPYAAIIVLTTQQAVREAVDAVRAGADNYLTCPLNPDELLFVVESLRESSRLESELNYLRDNFWRSESSRLVESNSLAMRQVLEKIRMCAPTNALVLLTGETGTGKNIMARLIHRHSARGEKQFISVHCGAIPDNLIESELFGHEKGSFTGAVKRKLGKFELAHGGTIFLDEVGTISHAAQIRLLQVLQERTFQRVGGETTLETDARIIAASNEDLKSLTQSGAFRSDLYYRLNVFPIEIPALRHRREDIPLLVRHFLQDFKNKYGKDIRDAHPLVLDALQQYDWPGNVRELQNLLERAFILENSHILTPESFPQDIFSPGAPAACLPLNTSLTLAQFREVAKENAERQYLKELLAGNKGRINLSAQQAGISTRQLHKLLTKYGIHKEEYKGRG